MRPRFQADADFNNKIVTGLRRREPAVDIWTARDGEVISKQDPEVLSIAADAGRILLTHDRTTMTRHFATFRRTRSSPGVLIVAQDLDIGAAIEDLLVIWAASDETEWVDRVDYLPL
jgi:predicted nuclease of predicted toxin-antitoxin system